VVGALIVLGTFVVSSYFWRYERPSMGMGAGGMVRDPVHAILLLGHLLAGPLNLVFRRFGPPVCVVVLFLLAWESTRALRSPDRWLATLLAGIAFLVLSALSIVAGRLDVRWLAQDVAMPDKYFAYFTMTGVFWSFAGLFVLYTCWQRRRRPLLLAFYGVLFCLMMFGHMRLQLIKAEDWADFFRGVDITGSALLLDASDDQYLSVLWPRKAERDDLTEFLRGRRLAMFREPRATWFRRRLSDLFQPAEGNRCIGAIEKTTPLNGCWRVEGWAWDTRSGTSPDDILLVDSSGQIVGLGGGGLRHGYLPGFPIDPHPAVNSHARFRHSEWFGYVRQETGTAWPQVTVYGTVAGGRNVCRIGQ
jgi:hypothetical protein